MEVQVGSYLDGFVTKLSPDGSHLVYSSLVGGRNSDAAYGVAVDADGFAFVTGKAQKTFPARVELQPSAPNYDMSFVIKIRPEGGNPVYATALSGNATDVGQKIAVDDRGRALVVGTTGSAAFPVVRALQNRISEPIGTVPDEELFIAR